MGPLGRLAWPWTVRAWVLLCLLAWLPGVPPRLALPWWFGIASLLVIAVGLRQPMRRKVTWTSWWLLGCLTVFWLHQTQFGVASKWLMASVTALVAAHLVSERGESRWLKEAVIWAAWAQLPVCLLQALGVPVPYTTLGTPPWGSVGDRIDLSILWAIASVFCGGVSGWIFALLALTTQSLTGAVAILWMVWTSRWPGGVRTVVLGSVVVLGALLGPSHFGTRWGVWSDVMTWTVPWPGLGFLSLPGGFTYDDQVSQLLGIRDTHSVWVDWLVRTGVVGAGMLLAAVVWTWRRSPRPLWLLAIWVGTWQSLEGRPVLACFAWWWVAYLEASDGRVDSGSEVAAARHGD